MLCDYDRLSGQKKKKQLRCDVRVVIPIYDIKNI